MNPQRWIRFINIYAVGNRKPDNRLISRLNKLRRLLPDNHALQPPLEKAEHALNVREQKGGGHPAWPACLRAVSEELEKHHQVLPGNAASLSAPFLSEEQRLIRNPEIILEFKSESVEYSEEVEKGILKLEAQRLASKPQDPAIINKLFRAFHSLKGTAGFLGFEPIQQLAHQTEKLLQESRDQQLVITPAIGDLILQASDQIFQMIQDLRHDDPTHEPAVPESYHRLLAAMDLDQRHDPSSDTNKPAMDDAPSAKDTADHTGLKNETIRVNVNKLDGLLNTIGELVILQAMLAEESQMIADRNCNLVNNLDQLEKISRNLQDISLSLRMVPLRSLFQKSERAARDLSLKLNKPIQFTIQGEETEIDRNMVESLSDPLVHMIRNALDHGIEDPETRRAQGKPHLGHITLNAYHASGYVYIELQDDGKGLDRHKILEHARAKGLITSEQDLSDQEIFRFVFQPGFSTAETLTEVSGRGVGMDVVKENITALQGRIDIFSEPGAWTKFVMQLPLTLAIIDGLLIKIADHEYIIPTLGIRHIWRPHREDISTVAGQGELVLWRNRLMPIFHLYRALGISGAKSDPTQAILLMCEYHGRSYALLIDELIGQQQIVIKSLNQAYICSSVISGAAVLGDGRIRLVLDSFAMLEFGRHSNQHTGTGQTPEQLNVESSK